ncbi:MAG: GHKL domain-containing protein [Lachnospiraceae bacterium]
MFFWPLMLYYAEILKYFIGLKLIFTTKIKRIWMLLIGWFIYGVIIITHPIIVEDIYLLVYLWAGIISLFMIEGKVRIRVFRILSLFCIATCLDELSGIIFGYIFGKNIYSAGLESALESLVTIGIFCILYLFKIKAEDIRNIGKFNYAKKAAILSVICSGLCLACTIGGLLYAQKYIHDSQTEFYLDIAGIIAYICVIILVTFLLYMKSANEKMEQLIETEEELKQMRENYYLALLEKEECTRQYRHDMNNHLLCLKEFAIKESASNTKVYIEKMQEKLSIIQKKCYITGNDILDILLNYYLMQVKNTQISVKGKCICKPEINDLDFCTIFSNLIQNAVEETERQCGRMKYIDINIKQGQIYLVIEIKNSSDLIIKEGQMLFKTKKMDRQNHGIGLRNVQESVNKNRGIFEMGGDGNTVSVKVTLKNNHSQS